MQGWQGIGFVALLAVIGFLGEEVEGWLPWTKVVVAVVIFARAETKQRRRM
jgi:hypothetical protein